MVVESLVDGIKRATDVMMSARSQSLQDLEMWEKVVQLFKTKWCKSNGNRSRSICALQAAMEGYEVVLMDEMIGQADIVVWLRK